MTSFGQYPLVYQLKQQGDGSFIPIGLAETSAFPSLSAVSLVVSSISATNYQGINFTGSVSFTGVLSVDATGDGISFVVTGDPQRPKIRGLTIPTNGFLTPTIPPASPGDVEISWGANPLPYDHGGTNSADTPTGNGVAHWDPNGGTPKLITVADFTYASQELNIPSGGKYKVGGSQITLNNIDGIQSPNTLANIPTPTLPSTYLIYNGTGTSWSAVTGTGGASLPTTSGRIPITNNATTLDTDPDLTYNSSTKVLTTYSINNVCDVCAVKIIEGGQQLSVKYQGKDDTLVAIAGLNPGSNELIFFTNTNTAATAALTPLARDILADSTPADMRSTLVLGNIATRDITSPPAGGLYFENDPTGTFSTDTDLTFDKGTNTLKSPTVCATTVCATTIQEGGQTLTSKYLTQANAAVTYQPCDVFLETLSNQGWVNLNSADVCNTLPVTNGGTGLNTISNGQIVVGTGTNTIGTIAAPTNDTYLRYDGGAFAWSVIPTGTGTTLPSDACAVVFMNTTGNALTSNKAIRVINSASTLEVFSDTEAANPGGINLYPAGTQQGHLRWNSAYATLGIQGAGDTNISLGVDELMPVVNNTGDTINKGQVCYVSGSAGGTYRGTISKLSSNNTTAYIIGVALNNITNSSSGYLIKKGLIKNASLTNIQKSGESWTAGQFVYVSDESGKLTNVAPGAGVHAARIGIILDTGGGNASIGVVVDRGYDLNELHDVDATPTNDGETLVWNTGNSSYVTGTINSITGTLTVAKGGTGKTSFTANQLIYGDNFAQDSNLYYSNNVLYASAASATTNVSAGGSTYGGNATVAGYVLTTGNIATIGGSVAAVAGDMSAINFFQNGININAIYQPTGNYQPNNTRLHELTAVSIDGLLRFNGSNYVTQPTSTYETTANANATYLTKATYNAFTGTLQDLAYLDNVNLTGVEVVGTLPVTKGGTGLTTLTANNFLVGNGTSISLIPTATYETTANANATYLTKTTYNAFTGTLQDLAYLDQVSLTTTSVTGTLPILNGGTSKTSFTTQRLIYGQFDQDPNLTFDGTVFKSPTVCGTTVCGTTILEAGQSLTSKYLTQANAATTYQPTNAKLHQVTAVTTEGLLYFNGTSYASQVTSTYATPGYVTTQLASYTPLSITGQFETTANAQATYLGKSAFTSWSGALALSAGLLDVQITGSVSNGQVLKWNGSKWANANDATGTGGTGSPGGSDKQVQFNNESSFAGSPGLTFDLTTSTLRAQSWSNLPSGSAYWNANQLSGYPIVSSLAGNPGPVNGNSLFYFTTPTVPVNGWYYETPAGSPGGSNTQIQFNNSTQFSGSPALTWDNSTSTLVSKQLSATTVSAGTIHVGGSDGYIRNNNGSIGISAIGGSVQISGTNSVSLQGIPINSIYWPQAGTGPGVTFYSETNELWNLRLNSTALNGTRDGGANTQGFIVASYLTSAGENFALNPIWNATAFTPGNVPDLPTNKDILVYNNNIYGLGAFGGKGWTWEQLSLSGGYLSDVSSVAPTTNNQALVYDSTGAKWKPGYAITYGIADPTGGADGDIYLQYE